MQKSNYFKFNKRNVFIIITLLLLVNLLCFKIVEQKKDKDKDKNKNKFSRTIPNGFGVNTHLTGNSIDINLIKDAGFKVVRQDITWESIEKEPGVFDFEDRGYDELTNALVSNNIRPYYILNYSNRLYEENKSIVTKKGQDAFVRYVSEVTSRYKDKEIIWEIWNEPNGSFWEPKPNIKEYSSLLKRVSKTIKENDPSGVVVAPALARLEGESLLWLEEIFKKGILDYIDALSVHPYRTQNPETVANDYKNLRNMMSIYTDRDIPIFSGEWGYPTVEWLDGLNLNEDSQANYLVRMFLINLLSDIPISIWYDWKNDGTDPRNGEHHFGLRQNDSKVPKKSYMAINTMNYILNGFNLNKRIEIGNPNDYILIFTNKKNEKTIVFWTSENTHRVDTPFNFNKGRIFSLYGEEIGKVQGGASINLELTNSPKYIIIR
ncbi:cellulase family glycosylhydrolase [Peribacillus frigoritolerans]|uniref:cellulase family glycosylhydrolase n=1 Tax=Peribacillus frigoritolerans TaxID=450367 RepID=UPI00330645BC